MGDVLIRRAGYDEDFFLWTQEQAQALRSMPRGTNAPLDWENIAEEIESLGKSDRRRCESFVRQILLHLLKLRIWPHPEPRNGWKKEIRAFRFQLKQILKDSPSLRARMPEFVTAEQGDAIETSAQDYADHPELVALLNQAALVFPFTHNQVLDQNYYAG